MNDENYKLREIRDFVTTLTEVDHCEECDEKTKIICCDKCANAVCCNHSCSILFPHHNGGVYAVCNSCKTQIETKLRVLVDLDKLKLLKRKIKRRMQKT